MDVKIQQQWKEKLQGEFDKEYFKNLVSFLHAEKAAGKTIYPPGSQIFNAFELTIVIPAEGPSFGMAPSGTWIWTSLFWISSALSPSSCG